MHKKNCLHWQMKNVAMCVMKQYAIKQKFQI